MEEKQDNINQNRGILLSRNTPVALVVGAAGFIGSNLAELLLQKNIQVIGVDNFSTGKKQNLTQLLKKKDFHLIESSADEISLNISRLDYIFIVSGGGWNLRKFLKFALDFKSKIVFVSSIELYDQKRVSELLWYKKAEEETAKFAQDNKINARVVRLASVFGPRMHFRENDPVIRLIQAALLGELQDEVASLEFSSRALFIHDAVNLIIKSMLKGSTALKIFDGALLSPIKVSEIRQILLDPLWHETRRFKPSDLPSWQTPNLLKTTKELSWIPETSLVEALKETLNYFKENEVDIPEINENKKWSDFSWEEEKKRRLGEGEPEKIPTPTKTFLRKHHLMILVGILIIFYALVWPIFSLILGMISFRHSLDIASENLSSGNFDQSLESVRNADSSVSKMEEIMGSFAFLNRIEILEPQVSKLNSLIAVSGEITNGVEHTILGTQSLYEIGEKIASQEGIIRTLIQRSNLELSSADTSFSRALIMLRDDDFKNQFSLIKKRLDDLEEKVASYSAMTNQGRLISTILPNALAVDDKKTYIVILQNNYELRPSGGVIIAAGQIDFENGSIKNFKLSEVSNLEQLDQSIEPPKEIKEDLGQINFLLRDAGWEADFPASAKQIEWFYEKATKEKIDGVLSFDVLSLKDLLSVLGPVEVDGQNITTFNLYEKISSPSYLTKLTKNLLNKLFSQKRENWPKLAYAFNKSLHEKHILIYLADPNLLSFLMSENWAGAFPKKGSKEAQEDFLAVVEANFGGNLTNLYVKRNYTLDTTVSKKGGINHALNIEYANNSESNIWPAGKYKIRLRLYLPSGAKLNKVKWREINIGDQVFSFSDYGKSGYSFLLEIDPKEKKNLIIEYEVPFKLDLQKENEIYKLEVLKQPGTEADSFTWQINYPNDMTSLKRSTVTNLSEDRKFEVRLNPRQNFGL